MRKLFIASLLVAAAAPAETQAPLVDVSNGNGLYEMCQGQIGTSYSGTCHGYIYGVVDTVNGVLFCTPPGSTYGQDIDIVKAGLANHPEERQKASSMLIVKYLREVWPCAADKAK